LVDACVYNILITVKTEKKENAVRVTQENAHPCRHVTHTKHGLTELRTERGVPIKAWTEEMAKRASRKAITFFMVYIDYV
jgi:hypothetical protein